MFKNKWFLLVVAIIIIVCIVWYRKTQDAKKSKLEVEKKVDDKMSKSSVGVSKDQESSIDGSTSNNEKLEELTNFYEACVRKAKEKGYNPNEACKEVENEIVSLQAKIS